VSRLRAPARRGRRSLVLAASAVVNSIGTGLYLALIPVYAVLHIGIDPVQVGLVVGVANLVALASPLPAGWLTDHYGAAPVWTGLLLARAVGYACFPLVTSFEFYVVLR